jgi:hypothetical protein
MKETIPRNPFLLASELSNAYVISRYIKCINSAAASQKKEWGAATLSERKEFPWNDLLHMFQKQLRSDFEPNKAQLSLTFQVGLFINMKHTRPQTVPDYGMKE